MIIKIKPIYSLSFSLGSYVMYILSSHPGSQALVCIRIHQGACSNALLKALLPLRFCFNMSRKQPCCPGNSLGDSDAGGIIITPGVTLLQPLVVYLKRDVFPKAFTLECQLSYNTYQKSVQGFVKTQTIGNQKDRMDPD